MVDEKNSQNGTVVEQGRFFKWEDANLERVAANLMRHLLVGQYMTFSLVKLGPNFETAGQAHPDAEEFEFILKGKLQQRIGDEERVLGPGEVSYVPRNTFHKGKVLGEEVIILHASAPPRTDFIDRSFTRYCK